MLHVAAESDQWVVQLAGNPDTHANSDLTVGERNRFDVVVIACPAFVAAKLLATGCSKLSSTLRSIPHVSTATVNLWYPADHFSNPLDGYGFVIPGSEQRGLTAVTWTSPSTTIAPDDLRLVRAYLGRRWCGSG